MTSMLLVWVTRDTVVPNGCLDAYREAISGAKKASIESAGHREIEYECSRVINEFLS
jgi:hypothetical protein